MSPAMPEPPAERRTPWGSPGDERPLPLTRKIVQIAVGQHYPTPLSEGAVDRLYALANDGLVWVFIPDYEITKSPGLWHRLPDLPQD